MRCPTREVPIILRELGYCIIKTTGELPLKLLDTYYLPTWRPAIVLISFLSCDHYILMVTVVNYFCYLQNN